MSPAWAELRVSSVVPDHVPVAMIALLLWMPASTVKRARAEASSKQSRDVVWVQGRVVSPDPCMNLGCMGVLGPECVGGNMRLEVLDSDARWLRGRTLVVAYRCAVDSVSAGDEIRSVLWPVGRRGWREYRRIPRSEWNPPPRPPPDPACMSICDLERQACRLRMANQRYAQRTCRRAHIRCTGHCTRR